MKNWKDFLHWMGFYILFAVGLRMFIAQAVDYKSFEWWESVLMTLPMVSWVYWVWSWIKTKIKQPEHPGLRYTKGGYWYDMYTGRQLVSVRIEEPRPEQFIYDEWISGDSSRDGSEDSAGAERESGVSSRWSHDIPESRPKDGKA